MTVEGVIERVFLAVLMLGLGSGCSSEEDEDEDEKCTVPLDTSYDPAIDPANFVAAVDNPFFPLPAGKSWTYKEGAQQVKVVVTSDKKTILGVSCSVVRDTVTVSGEVIEDTYDWYAQDKDGTVWYFGEDTTEFVKGEEPSKEGSWEAGVDGAKPGIIMQGKPAVGQKYRQEYYSCHAEDMAEVLALDASVTVPLGSYDNCVKTRDTTPLEPDVNENKYYCSGIGLVKAEDVTSGDTEELEAVEPP